MMVMGPMRRLGALHILLQAGKGTLRTRKVTRLQGALERLEIGANLAGRTGRIAGRSRRLGRLLHVLLQGGKSLLGTGHVTRLEGGLESFEVLSALFETALDTGLVGGRSRIYTRYVHDYSINCS